MHLKNLIGSEWRSTGDTLESIRPATGETLAWVPRSNAEDIDQAVKDAAIAQPAWGRRSREERALVLERIADGIESRLDEFASAESADTGKPVSLASRVDIPRAIANFRFFAGAIRHTHEEMYPMADALNYTLRQPLGVVGLITPWNLPIYLLSWKAAPALAMGNAVVAKPSELTPWTATLLGEVALEAGLPAGVYNVVHGFGAEAGAALVEHSDVKAISFTGGTATGRVVAAQASSSFKKLSLELGGKNPTLVFADADFDRAVEGAARAAFTNQGQVCLCGSRILVQRELYPRFVEALSERVQAMKVGDPSDPETQLGALVSAAHRDKVDSYISLARDEGGTVVAGGSRPAIGAQFSGGFFLEPTVITGLPTTSRCATEEIFGPVATVHPFEDEDEAVAVSNGVEYGLAASVWTRDLGRAHRVSARLESGMVWVNTWLHRDLRVVFGGMKNSGVGREGGEYSLDFYSEARNICIKLDDGGSR
ncbi:MAG: aldehyde dehydrogenase [Myxococcota bacterium]